MRNTILFIIFLIFSFLINVIFYFVSDDYRVFLKNLKNEEVVIEEKPSFINDDFSKKEETNLDENIEIVKPDNENNIIFNKLDDNKVEIKSNVSLGKNYLDILDLFSNYDLQELELNTNLFDITSEYPDNYLEYYSKDLTLYFFPTKNYKDVYDIFSVLEYELPFKINELNNYGDNSFFINLNQDINDSFIRIVISNKGVVFGLKIKKNEYNQIKEKLNTLRTN
ncbi:MAG: hypothetical protein PHV23_06070 [Candidatus Gracilibacteria bacterium]|nr:hypothetical protein [Candidatus Gracilibacteria bacterium]